MSTCGHNTGATINGLCCDCYGKCVSCKWFDDDPVEQHRLPHIHGVCQRTFHGDSKAFADGNALYASEHFGCVEWWPAVEAKEAP